MEELLPDMTMIENTTGLSTKMETVKKWDIDTYQNTNIMNLTL